MNFSLLVSWLFKPNLLSFYIWVFLCFGVFKFLTVIEYLAHCGVVTVDATAVVNELVLSAPRWKVPASHPIRRRHPPVH